VLCQVLESPESSTQRLVPDVALPKTGSPVPGTSMRAASGDGEIRLTYGQLTALIADAFRTLKEQ
jgi:hypothetical protein